MIDLQIRFKAFEWLNEQVQVHGDVLPRAILSKGFEFDNERIPLVSPQGIFTPKIMALPLSITTAPKGPYDDSFTEDGFLQYRYRGIDPAHRDNVGLRKLYREQIPLIYFHGIIPGKYMAVWPVFIIDDDIENLTFKVAVDEPTSINLKNNLVKEDPTIRRSYITSAIKIRLHQRTFRERVLAAYQSQCSLCKLKHQELLDAAHIVPDSDPDGRPSVNNGIALCKLHHAAFDTFIIGISPDYKIEIRSDILKEIDGPMLKHGLIELHGSSIILPSQKVYWPDQILLDKRYQKFKRAG